METHSQSSTQQLREDPILQDGHVSHHNSSHRTGSFPVQDPTLWPIRYFSSFFKGPCYHGALSPQERNFDTPILKRLPAESTYTTSSIRVHQTADSSLHEVRPPNKCTKINTNTSAKTRVDWSLPHFSQGDGLSTTTISHLNQPDLHSTKQPVSHCQDSPATARPHGCHDVCCQAHKTTHAISTSLTPEFISQCKKAPHNAKQNKTPCSGGHNQTMSVQGFLLYKIPQP